MVPVGRWQDERARAVLLDGLRRAATAAHRLASTPLAEAYAYAELIAADPHLPEELRAKAREAADRVSEVAELLLGLPAACDPPSRAEQSSAERESASTYGDAASYRI
jgi:hypothetical protein